MQTNVSLVNFIDLNMDDKKMILQWRNHSEIKRWMYNSNDVSLKEHLAFIETLKESKDKLYFLLKENQKNIGIIDFTNITVESCEFGLYTNPSLRGYGKLLLSTIIEYAFNSLHVKKIIAGVIQENTKAIELYKKYNFTQTEIKKIQDKRVIFMELNDENR